jgi:hypothetical protein
MEDNEMSDDRWKKGADGTISRIGKDEERWNFQKGRLEALEEKVKILRETALMRKHFATDSYQRLSKYENIFSELMGVLKRIDAPVRKL